MQNDQLIISQGKNISSSPASGEARQLECQQISSPNTEAQRSQRFHRDFLGTANLALAKAPETSNPILLGGILRVSVLKKICLKQNLRR